MNSLAILPNEVVEIICSYLPKTTLVELKEAQNIQGPVIQTLFSTVYVTSKTLSEHWDINGTLFEYGIVNENDVRIWNIQHFIKIINMHPWLRPKKIVFENLSDMVSLAEFNPGMLKSTQIELADDCFRNPDLESVDQLASYPVDTIHGLKIDASYQPLLALAENTRCISCYLNPQDLDIFLSMELPNLQKLKLSNEVPFSLSGKFKTFAPNLTELDTVIDFSDVAYAAVEFEFPTCLSVLSIAVSENIFGCTISFQNLVNLESISFRSDMEVTILVPKDLISISCHGVFDFTSLASDHPNLQKLEYYPDSYELWKIIDLRENISRCDSLKCLALPWDFVLSNQIAGVGSCCPKFPESLTKLTLGSTRDYWKHTTGVAIDISYLNKVTHLEINSIVDIPILGSLPHNLTFLKVTNMDNISNLEPLIEDAMNLAELEFWDCGIPSTLNLPSTLKSLAIINSVNVLENLIVEGENLERLNVRGGGLYTLKDSTLSVPSTLKVLELRDCGISLIDESFDWPKSLTKLDLGGNDFEFIANLPESLKYLSCDLNELNPTEFGSDFPLGLKYLNLASTGLTNEDVKALDLKRYKELTDLVLKDNMVGGFDYEELFPPDLIFLSL
ncbi:hypothetical protein G210_4667 [Candida maltosa Xu316]|uniref:Uncharacterized protein n=1 Tax=Candida maltosa (strain Xu316) TaxID=1245528 RepID=M3JDM3_CANMX|nr:hypothetical protein G210_4667 [Candida maltosa Xu316]